MPKEQKNILLSVVIPAYNEEKRIGVTLSDLKRYFQTKDFSYEVIVVSDGSTDNTAKFVEDFARDFPALRLVEYSPNRGKGHAVQVGMLEARGEYRLFMDADNSVTIDTVEPFLEEMRAGGDDVTIGSIAFSPDEVIEHNGWHRRFLSSLSKIFVRAIATPGIYDTQRGFKLFTAKAAEVIFPLQKIERFGFDIEILVIARIHSMKIRELPVAWNNPAGSKVHLKAYAECFIELWRIYGNMLKGEYDPETRRSRRTSMVILFLGEFPSLLSRLVREILTHKFQIEDIRKRFSRRLAPQKIEAR